MPSPFHRGSFCPCAGHNAKPAPSARHIALAAIVVLALTAGGQESRLVHRERSDTVAVSFGDTHLSVEWVDSFNYKVGRRLDWNGIHASFADTNIEVNTPSQFIEFPVKFVGEALPAWIGTMQRNADTYQSGKTNKAQKNDDRLSAYSQTELSIARNMGLSPWDIDRERLRLWGLETDSVPQSQ